MGNIEYIFTLLRSMDKRQLIMLCATELLPCSQRQLVLPALLTIISHSFIESILLVPFIFM